MKDILHKILFWTKWTRKLSKPLITDADFEDIEKDIDEQLHIHEPTNKVITYTMKGKKKGGKKC